MREIIVAATVAALCMIAPFNPRIGVLSYVWFSLMRPDILAWATGKPYSYALAIAALCGCIRLAPRTLLWFRNPITVGLLMLMIPIGLSAVYAIQPDLSAQPLLEYGQIVLMALLVPLVIRSLDDLKWLLVIMAFSIGAVGFKFGAFGLAAGGTRFNGGIGGLMSDNNTMATGLAMGIPLCWCAFMVINSKVIKAGFGVLLVGSISAIVMTHSRGGALAAGAVLLMIAFRSKRRLITFALLSVATVPAVYLVKDTYFDRLGTLEHVDAESSAASRIVLAKAAVAIWRDYPVLGVGFGGLNERRIVGDYVEGGGHSDYMIHNTYLQMLVDSGTFAFIIYVCLLFGTILWLWISARRVRLCNPGQEIYPLALQTSLIAFAVGTISLSQIRFDFFYYVLTTVAAWRCVEVSTSLDQLPGEEAPAAAPPVEWSVAGGSAVRP
jgi:probable O-glycosylation ligase (exosortase A-associated)